MVEPVNTERALVMQVSVAPEDVGKVIGRDGRIINALRTLVRSAPMRRGSRHASPSRSMLRRLRRTMRRRRTRHPKPRRLNKRCRWFASAGPSARMALRAR